MKSSWMHAHKHMYIHAHKHIRRRITKIIKFYFMTNFFRKLNNIAKVARWKESRKRPQTFLHVTREFCKIQREKRESYRLFLSIYSPLFLTRCFFLSGAPSLAHTSSFFLALQSIIELWLWKLEQDPNFFTTLLPLCSARIHQKRIQLGSK